MGRRSKQSEHCHNMNAQRQNVRHISPLITERPIVRANKTMTVMNAIMEGTGYEAQKRQQLRMGMQPPGKSTFFREQKKVMNNMINYVQKDCKQYAHRVQPHTYIATDAAWNHRRNGSSATITAIDLKQDKVISAAIVSKQKGYFKGNFQGASNNMETEGVRRILNDLHDNIYDKNVTIVHDHDNKTSKILRGVGFPINETYDKGHAVQELKRTANEIFVPASNDLYFRENPNPDKRVKPVNPIPKRKSKKGPVFNGVKVTMKNCMSVFSSLLNHLVAFFVYLISAVKDPKQREKEWQNAENHFLGNHKNCHHPSENPQHRRGRPRIETNTDRKYWEWEEGKKDKELRNVLHEVLVQTTPLLLKTENERTQANESLNKNISSKHPKHQTFSTSNEARSLAAIGQKNNIHFETNFIKDYYPNLIPQVNIETLYQEEERRALLADKRNTQKEKQRKNHFRSIERAKHKEKPGDYKSKKPTVAVPY